VVRLLILYFITMFRSRMPCALLRCRVRPTTLVVAPSKTLPLTALQASTARYFSTVEIPNPPSSNHHHVPLESAQASIIYTETDEAPALATYALYPVIAKV
jgi:hypothetical protein